MIKNYYLTLLLLCLAFSFGYGQGSETFTNLDAPTAGYGNGSYTGDNSITWTYNEARLVTDTYNITGESIGFRDSGTRSVSATSDTNGVGDLTYSITSYFTGGSAADRSIEVYVNGTLYDNYTLGAMGTVYTRTITANETGAVLIEFRSVGSRQLVIDDVSWTLPSTDTLIEFVSSTSTVAEDGLLIGVCVGITNASASAATTVDIELDGTSTALNGTDFDDGAGTPAAIAFPLTLTFPAGSSADQCFTVYISNDDLLVEGDETVVLNLINESGGDSATLGTEAQHILTITDNDVAPIADVIITEIMYNTSGTDDEWIEICNTSGSTQVLNNYTIEVDGTTEFTFPSSGVVIADGDCITVSLGSNGDGIYNPDCPFTPDYGIDASTNNSNNLGNNNATVTLVASDGSTIVDNVFYDDNDDTLTDGNGSSFHVVDDSLDNSNTDTNWQAVVDGGSPGTNSLVSPCSSLQPEINIEGDLGAFPNINNNDITPSFLDNTLFSDQTLGNSQTKSFRIQNIGTADLIVNNVQLVGANPTEFSLTFPSTLPFVIPQNGLVVFDVTFTPTIAAERNATIRITNNDPTDSENIFEYAIRGTGICSASTNVLSPLTGPDNTVVTITGTDLSGTTFVEFDGAIIPHTVISATEIEITIPANSVSGSIDVTDNIGCVSSDLFTIIDTIIGSCEGSGGTTPTNLFISEVTDASTGGMSYIEIYNGTGATINLSNYSLQFYKNGSSTVNGGSVTLNNVNLASGSVYVVAISTSGASCAVPNSAGELADQTSGISGLNFGAGDDDHIRLYENTTHIDSWGTYSSDNWSVPLGIGAEGVVFTRNSTAATLPNTIFDVLDWTYVNWNSCAENDYSNIGTFDFSTGVPPTVTLQPVSTPFDCTFSASYTITGTEGYNAGGDTQELEYQWLYNAPGTSTWVEINSGDTDYSGQQSATLNILNTINFNGYQYYCQLREDTATCFSASNAVKLEALSSTWDGTSWSTPPSINRAVIIDGDYDTATEASFSGCSLVVNAGYELQVSNGTYIEIENDIIADGDITVFTAGSVVQNNDFATVTANGTITVQKITSMISTPYQYTYWSSPVVGETIENVFSNVPVSRRFVFNAANFIDNQIEIGNTNTFTPGQDDIDDNGDDWQLASGTMLPGVGYAATANTLGMLPTLQQFPFVGAFNNGVITPTVAHVTGSPYSDWNFIGNPYPSAIDTAVFFSVNSGTVNTIYLWSHATPENINASGNEGANFSASDYAIISGSGVNTAGGSGVIPNNFVPSGQGFFIETLDTSPITFNNAMRVTGNNDQFFRSETTETSRKVLWLNLSSDNGVSKQIAVAHLDGATDSYDGSFYDVTENKSSALAATFYSIISDSADEQFVIQGKDVNSLNLDEIIPLGFKTTIDVATLYTMSIAQFEGDFYTNNNIYLKDNLLNSTHNLKESDYTFTSEPGEFNDRFEIVFTTQALSIEDAVINANTISIVELNDGNVEFNLNTKQLSITNVEILDVLGRRIYNFKGNSATEVYNLSKLSQAAYIAKITLSNGQIISKKAIKK